MPAAPTGPVAEKLDYDALEAILREPLPRAGSAWGDVLAQFQRQVVDTSNRVDHPRFFGYIPLANNFVSVMADTLAAGYNIFNAVWLQGPGAAQIERLTVDWLRRIFGFPLEAGGTFVSGGSVANLSALAVARQYSTGRRYAGHAVAYCSDQIHFAISRGLRVLGFAPEQLRKIPSDEDYRISLPLLRAGDCVGSGGGQAALLRRRQRWHHEYGRGRSFERAGGSVPARAVFGSMSMALMARQPC